MTEKRQLPDKASGEGPMLKIPAPMDASRDALEKKMAESVPEWPQLSPPQRQELVELIIATRKVVDPVQISLVKNDDGGLTLKVAGPSQVLGTLKLQKTFGAVSMDPVTARLTELRNYLSSVGITDDDRINAALSYIESMEPRSQAEAMLLLQSYITHDAAVRSLVQMNNAEWMPNAQMNGNLGVKLLRTFQGQMDTLTKMRSGGEQVVRHIYIDNRNGGQAVVTSQVTTSRGGQNEKNFEQPHAAGDFGHGPAMLGHDPQGQGVPIASREGQEAMQDARRR